MAEKISEEKAKAAGGSGGVSRPLAELLKEEIETQGGNSTTMNYCWWCNRDVNGMDIDPEPHKADCWLVRARAALGSLVSDPPAPQVIPITDDNTANKEFRVVSDPPAWQPINSAPKDGRVLLSYWGKYPQFIAWIKGEGWRVLMPPARGIGFSIHGNFAPFTPEYWLSLPAPPVLAPTQEST